MTQPRDVPHGDPQADPSPRHKREWVAPSCTELPLLTELWLQGPQGSGIGGGGGPGGTVFPH
jgi:hypothetical protein